MSEWTEVKRNGEPVSISGGDHGSVRTPSEYEIRTTQLPAGAHGVDWRGLFNDQLKGPLVAFHDGAEKITVYCEPDDEPKWLERVDAAIAHANKRLKSLYG